MENVDTMSYLGSGLGTTGCTEEDKSKNIYTKRSITLCGAQQNQKGYDHLTKQKVQIMRNRKVLKPPLLEKNNFY